MTSRLYAADGPKASVTGAIAAPSNGTSVW